ncbi:MAG: hypothetical protein O2954_01845 [bacterium]|nr:hypothetical protein [bacterium]
MSSSPIQMLKYACLMLVLMIPGLAHSEPSSAPEWKHILPPEFEPFELKYLTRGDFQHLLRSLDIPVSKMEFYENTLFLSFPDDESRAQAVEMHQKMDVRPPRAVLHLWLILATQTPQPGYGEPASPSLQTEIEPYFDFPSYQIMDRTYVHMDSGEKGDSYLAGRYKATIKPRVLDSHTIKLEEFTLRDLDPGYNLAPEQNRVDPKPTTVSDALRKTDTRLIKAKFTMTDQDTVVAGGWLLEGGKAALITVMTVKIIE